MRKQIYIYALVLLLLTLTGCNLTEIKDNSGGEDTINTNNGNFKMVIDWQKLDYTLTNSENVLSTQNITLPKATDFGIRLIYPASEAVYMERNSRKDGETGIITLDVPKTDNAVLQVIVVSHSEDWRDDSFILGVARVNNLCISTESLTELTLDDIHLVNPDKLWGFINGWEEKLSGMQEVHLPANNDFTVSWKWNNLDPFNEGGWVNGRVQFLGNLGKLDEQTNSWHDLGSYGGNGVFNYDLPAQEAGTEMTMGFIIWLSGKDFGLESRSYILPSTTRNLPLGESKTKWRFIFE